MRIQKRLEERRLSGGFIHLVVAGALIACPQQGAAHHSFAPLLTPDGDEVVEIFEGSIDFYKLLNPHTALIVNVTDENGAVEDWLVEMSSSATLVREGWADDSLSAGDKVTIAILRSRTPNRGRLRAVLVHGATDRGISRLFVAYGIRGDTLVMRRLRARLPVCGSIAPRLDRSECFFVDAQALRELEEEFPGKRGYVMP